MLKWEPEAESLTVTRPPGIAPERELTDVELHPGEDEAMSGERLARHRIMIVLRTAQEYDQFEIQVAATEEGRRITLSAFREGKRIHQDQTFIGPAIPEKTTDRLIENWVREFFDSIPVNGKSQIAEPRTALQL